MSVCCCSTIYNMCTQKPPHDYSEPLYKRYGNAFSTYITDKVRSPQRLLSACLIGVEDVHTFGKQAVACPDSSPLGSSSTTHGCLRSPAEHAVSRHLLEAACFHGAC